MAYSRWLRWKLVPFPGLKNKTDKYGNPAKSTDTIIKTIQDTRQIKERIHRIG